MAITLSDPKLKFNFVQADDLLWITYIFPGYDTITITGTQMIAIAKDYHRIWDGTQGHMIPTSFIAVTFEVRDGGTAFRF